jgi:hypothetical protein
MKLLSTVLLLSLLGSDANAQTLLHTFKPKKSPNGDPLESGLGYQLEGLGDLDSDGVGDFAMLSFGYGNQVHARSAVSGGTLWSASGTSWEEFGLSIAALDDVNGDGIEDLAVGAPGALGGYGRVYLLSGIDGSTLQTWEAGSRFGRFGHDLAALDDIDDDGLRDLLIGAPAAWISDRQRGVVTLRSTASGEELYWVGGQDAGEQFGAALAAIGDVDLDGVSDFAVAAPKSDIHFALGGRIEVRSGATGAALTAVPGQAIGARTGSKLSGLGDVDLDGSADLLASLSAWTYGAVSGRTGDVLYQLAGLGNESGGIAGLGDINGDGLADFAVRSNVDGDVLVLRSGVDGAELSSIHWQTNYPWGTVASVGDVDLDGRSDLLASATGSSDVEVRLYTSVTNPPPGTVSCSADMLPVSCPCQGKPLFEEDFDGGGLPPGWTATGLWHITSACAGCGGSDPYAYFGNDSTCIYNDAPSHNSLITPWIQLPQQPQGKLLLTFCHSIQMDMEGNRAWVYVRGEDGTTMAFYSGTSVAIPYDPQPYEISSFLGKKIRIEWYFFNDFIGYLGGWRVDDVSIHWGPNDGAPGQGCMNSSGQGAVLRAVGSTSVAADDLLLSVTQMPPQTTGVFIVGDARLQPPLSLRAGLLCTGGTIARYAGESAGALGAYSLSGPVSLSQGLIQAGESYAFQAWYRDLTPLAPCAATSNLSNSVLVTFAP